MPEPASSILFGDGVEGRFKFRLKSLQVAILLSEPGQDFEGGEFVLTEQRPRAQSRALVVPLAKGDAVVFAVSHRPVRGTRGIYRVNLARCQ